MTAASIPRDSLYEKASSAFAPAIRRLARATEMDADLARDLEQDIHLALWRSFSSYDGRCALTTWVYRVAHNVAADHVAKQQRKGAHINLEAIGDLPAEADLVGSLDTERTLARVLALVARLKPADRSVILLYLEGLDAVAIAAVTGLTASNVAVKVHRTKALLSRKFGEPE